MIVKFENIYDIKFRIPLFLDVRYQDKKVIMKNDRFGLFQKGDDFEAAKKAIHKTIKALLKKSPEELTEKEKELVDIIHQIERKTEPQIKSNIKKYKNHLIASLILMSTACPLIFLPFYVPSVFLGQILCVVVVFYLLSSIAYFLAVLDVIYNVRTKEKM